MRDGSPKRPRRRRGGRAKDSYADFYTSYYGLDEPAGRPTRHRAAASRTGAALVAGLGALMQRKVVVILTLGISAIVVLAVGVMASATRTGSDANRAPSFVDTTTSPTEQIGGVAAAEATSSHPAPSPSATATSSAAVISTPADVPVYAPPPVVVGPTTSQAAAPPPSSHTTTKPASSPTTHHSTPPPTRTTSSVPPPPPTSSTSTPSPTPSPSSTCKVWLTPSICLIKG